MPLVLDVARHLVRGDSNLAPLSDSFSLTKVEPSVDRTSPLPAAPSEGLPALRFRLVRCARIQHAGPDIGLAQTERDKLLGSQRRLLGEEELVELGRRCGGAGEHRVGLTAVVALSDGKKPVRGAAKSASSSAAHACKSRRLDHALLQACAWK
jgi:hypothetical protein